MSETEAAESGMEQPTPEQEAAVNGEEQTAQSEESSSAQETTKEPEATTEEPEAEPEATTEEPEAEPEATKQDQSETTTPPQQPVPVPAVTAPKVKHDWYQTQADVCVNVMIKRLKKEDVSVEFGEQSLEVRLQLGEGQPHTLAFQLAHHVVPEKSSFKVLTTKVSPTITIL